MQEYINIDGKGNILDFLKKMNEGFAANAKSSESFQNNAAGSLGKIQNSLKSVNLAAFHQNLQNVGQGFQDLNAPGLQFSSSLSDLSALTGLAGKDLDQLGSKARASAKEFGGTAAESLESYKTILSRLGPDIAKDQTALAEMERNVRTLSKTMGNDAVGSVDALTTAMLQYGVDLSNPAKAQKEMARMMNVMAAGAKYGAAEVPQISAALKVSGVAAKQANVTFEETNAALQSLAAGGKEGSEAGMALRNVLGKMAGEDVIPKEAAEKLKRLKVNMDVVSNTSLPFATRLKELKKAQGDATIMAQVFGTENAAAANILLNSVDAQEKLTRQVTGTNDANEQAAIVMESTAEKMARMKASIDDAKLAFFEATGGATAYLQPVTEVLTTVNSFAPIFSLAKTGVSKLSDAIKSGNTPLKTTATTAKDASTQVGAMGKASKGAGSMMSSLGGALKGVGIAAFIGLVVEAAHQLYQMASGADAAERAMKRMQTAREEGEKSAEKLNKKFSTQYDDEIRKIEQLKTAGEISDKEYLERKKKAAKTQEINYSAERANLKGLIDIQKQNAAQALKDGDDKKKRAAETSVKELSAELYGIAEQWKESKNIVLDLEAEQQGKGKSITSPSGYTPSKSSSEAEKVMSGAGEVKRIDVRIDTLVKSINITSSNLKEGLGDIKKQVSEALIGAVRDFEVAI